MTIVYRLKDVFTEKYKAGSWLADSLAKAPSTLSKWCTTTSQPSIESARQLKADLANLLIKGIQQEFPITF